MYRVDFHKVAIANIKELLRQTRMKDWLQALLKPLDTLNIKFDNFQSDVSYRLKFNGQQIYLEHYLNDQFDDANRNIYIDNETALDRRPLYLKRENEVPRQVLYRKWKTGRNYMTNERVTKGGKVWKSEGDNNQGNDPETDGGVNWTFLKDQVVWYRKSDIQANADFIVYMPDNITYDTDKLKAEINRFKPAGKQYIIETYTP